MVEKLDKDMIEAMKSKDKDKLTVIRMVKASLKQEQIDHKKEINDDLISEFEKGNRTDLIEKTQAEIDILMNYLPEQLSSEEVNKIIDEIFAEVNPTGPKDMGKVMQQATAKLKGKADMKEVSTIIRERLN